jgi:hypothetical protein
MKLFGQIVQDTDETDEREWLENTRKLLDELETYGKELVNTSNAAAAEEEEEEDREEGVDVQAQRRRRRRSSRMVLRASVMINAPDAPSSGRRAVIVEAEPGAVRGSMMAEMGVVEGGSTRDSGVMWPGS